MVNTRVATWRHKLAVGLLLSAMVLAGLWQSPADANHMTVTAVEGSAFNCDGAISFFGGEPQVTEPTASVTLPSSGSATPLTETAPCTIQIQFPTGPGPIVLSAASVAVSTQGTTGATGSVTSSATATDVGTDPNEALQATSISSTCTANETGATGSTTVTGGTVVTDQNAGTTVEVPENPTPGFAIEGVNGAGDRYRYIFNEQTVDLDGSITVNAVHLELLGPNATGDVILGQVVCGVTTTVAPTTTTTTAPTTTTTSTPATTTTSAPTTTTTSTPATTTTSTPATTTTSTPATTTTSTPPQGGPVQIDDLALSDGEVIRVTGTITCEAGNRYRLRVEVIQGETNGRTIINGNCTGDSQRFRAITGARSGPGFEDGTAQVRITGQIGDPDARTIEDRFTTSEDVQVDVRDGMAAAVLQAAANVEGRG